MPTPGKYSPVELSVITPLISKVWAKPRTGKKSIRSKSYLFRKDLFIFEKINLENITKSDFINHISMSQH